NSVKKAFDYLGARVIVTTEPAIVASAEKVVLPGVGHFTALAALNNTGLREALLQAASAGKPFLGICLGMQWLFDGSEECLEVAGAEIFPGSCRLGSSRHMSAGTLWQFSEAHGFCEASHKIRLSTTRTLSMRRWTRRP